MKSKRMLFGMLALVLAFGIGLALTGCEAKSVDIIVTNSSSATALDGKVKAQVWGTAGGTTPLEEQEVVLGESVTFTMDEGDYRVRIIDGINFSWWYPSGGTTVTTMTGVVKLKFTGTKLDKE